MVALEKYAAPAAALLVMVGIGIVTRQPGANIGNDPELRERYSFQSAPMSSVPVDGYRTIRQVEPALAKLRTWISGVGAGLAQADIAGSGLPADVCLVDPRTNTITVSPAPGTGTRFAPFVLGPGALPFDRVTTAPTGCLPGDFNQDGRTDLLTYYWGRTPILHLHRGGAAPLDAASFTAQEVWPTVERWYTDTVDSADVDGDGHPDLIIGNYFPDGARLLDPAAHDDPKLQMNDSMTRAFNGGTNRIMLWKGATQGAQPHATFADQPGVLKPQTATAWTLAIGAQDLDGDHRPELYFANDFGPDRMLRNESTPGRVKLTELRGSGGFTVPKSKVLGNDSFKGMGIDFGDLDGDGRTDMFVSNISAQFGLMETNFAWVNTGASLRGGNAPFTDRSEELGLARSGWGWDAKLADFDNDGRPEVVQATGFAAGEHNLWPQVSELAMANDTLLSDPSAWMRQTPGWELAGHQHPAFFAAGSDGRYADIGGALGLDRQGLTRAVSTADVNGDGKLDFGVATQWGESYFYLNQSTSPSAGLDLRLVLPPVGVAPAPAQPQRDAAGDRIPGVPAVGAEATITLPGGKRISAQVDGGNGHASVRSPVLHFGLGELSAATPLPVTVRWRDFAGTVRSADYQVTPGRWTILLPGGQS